MELMERIDSLIEERHLLRHSFYRKWLDGTLPPAALQDYARQYFSFEANFPRILSAIHSRCERPDVRAALLENLWDEEHGEANHRELWLRFAEGLGVDRGDVEAAEPNAATAALLESYWSASNATVAAGVAAVYAYERQVPAVAAAKIDGLRANFGIDDPRTLAFFEVHSTLDVEHSDAERRIVAELGAEDEAGVLEATRSALDAWWSFLDAVDPVPAEGPPAD
jgi:pyrroloquinoline-quinone synthase